MLKLSVALLALASMTLPASAHHRQSPHHYRQSLQHYRHAAALAHGYRRGRAWCGAYMRHVFGIADPSLNLARNWARQGANAGGPQVGAVVVWAHHVGVIRGGPDGSGQWLVESGNDGHAVRTRYRSLRGAIAFRYVNGGGFASAESYAPSGSRTARSRRSNQLAQAAVGYTNYSGGYEGSTGYEGYSAGYGEYAPAGKRRHGHRIWSRRYALNFDAAPHSTRRRVHVL